MAQSAISSQTSPYPFPKPYLPYVQPSKPYTNYPTSNAPLTNTPVIVKNNQIKNYCSISTSCGTINSNAAITTKLQNSQAKTLPSFLQNRNLMKNSMINAEQQTSTNKQATPQPQSNTNQKKIPRMSQHVDMKLSSIELGTQGYKIPSFLNKQKKLTPPAPTDRPQSLKDSPLIKDSQQVDNILNTSTGNKKKGIQYHEIKQQSQELIKTSWYKKKQKSFNISHFQIIKQLGTGKYGKVFLVRDKLSNFICALKVLEKSIIKEQELKIQTFLNHTNVIKMFGFFDDTTNIYLIMQLATGGQLFQQLKKHQSMPQIKVAPIMRQVCHAILQLHTNRIIHRDIKPQNIVLNCNVVKLCDFGWSVYCDTNLRTTFCGTPLYVGPQILKGKQYDQKIDIWSLGVMMYQMLIGQNPFKITKQQQLMKIIKDQIIIPKYVQLTHQAKNFLFSCLQKNPTQRLTIRQLLNHQFFKLYPQKNDKKITI